MPEQELTELRRLLSLSRHRRREDYKRMAQLTERAIAGDSAVGETPREDREWEALLLQYQTLREESLNSTNNRIQVLMLGAAAMAALLGGALTIERPQDAKLLIYALFSVSVPLIWIFVLLVWMSEAVRAHRVGFFLAGDVEARINARVGGLTLSWEAALWTGALPRDEGFGPSAVAFGVLLLLAVVAPICGIWLSGTYSPWWWVAIQLSVPYGALAWALMYVKRLKPRFENTDFVRSLWPGD